jgi:damage-control phosphatase, subfamily I
MLIKPDCISCILKMAITAIRKLTADEEVIRELTVRILTIPALQGRQWDLPSPEVIERVMEMLIESFGTADPFQALKQEQNRIALALYPALQKMVREADDPLQTAVKLAIVGNAIDLMVTDRVPDLEKMIRREVQQPLPGEVLAEFLKKLGEARTLVYLADNSGEIVFDKLLLETIQDRYSPRVTFVVRSVPALNDATWKEAEMVGLDQVASIMVNGLTAPVPGTVLARCSSALREKVRDADLVISKGGGNFDTLEGEKDLESDISFLLLSKCIPYNHYFKTEMYRPVLANFFRKKKN